MLFFLQSVAVELTIELGHTASLRNKKPNDGFTHDFTVFVRGAEKHEIRNVVEKVVFHLHESYPRPRRGW